MIRKCSKRVAVIAISMFASSAINAILFRVLILAICLITVGAGILFLVGGNSRAAVLREEGKASPDGIWEYVAESSIAPQGERKIIPLKYRTVRLNLEALKARLANAPMEFSERAKSESIEISLPTPDGTFNKFRVVESPMMEPKLAAEYPDIKNYSGHGIDDPTASMRFDLTPDGFHAFVLATEGTFLVAPYAKNDTTNYISYYLRDNPSENAFNCFMHEAGANLRRPLDEIPQVDNGATLHTYRLAVAATAEYTAQNGGTVASAISAINTTITGVNAIYAVEVSIRLTLIGNENAIIYTNSATDPYTSQVINSLIAENQANLDAVIGSANYDIGQVFDSTNATGGAAGLASLAVVCDNSRKGRGTSGGNFVLLVAHEIGHQFGATHTFNDSVNGSCGSFNGANQRDGASAYEPGSGSTIMSYGGTCGAANLQQARDSYFHIRSLEQIVAYTTGNGGGSGCDVETPTNRGGIVITAHSPEITVPARTPFMLSIQAVDISSDPRTLRFNWEEYDLGAASPPEGDNGDRPIFRSNIPFTSLQANTGARSFPAMQYVFNNDNIPPPTYQCGIDGMGNPVICLTGESRTTTTRNMTFQATARDGVSAIHSVPVLVHVVDSGAPFAITNLNAPNITWAEGTRQTIVWNTANTASAPFNVTNVKITLVDSMGRTTGPYVPIVLADSTPNDGNADILVPVFDTAFARIKIESIINGNFNYFFDISNNDIRIRPIGVLNTNDSGLGSLRQAILDANSDPGLSNIQFNINGAGVQTINLLTELPLITSPVILDGWSQGGANYSGPPLVELNGAGAGTNVNGIVISAGNSTINGLAINRFNLSGIDLRANGGNLIEGCYIGTNATGTAVAGNGANGVFINGTPNNRLGAATLQGQFRRNIIAGNSVGVLISGVNASGNALYHNYIGTSVDGLDLGNTLDGIQIVGAPNNIIGGTRLISNNIYTGTGNVISGNGSSSFGADGIEITGNSATGNVMQANLIGVNPAGTAALGNLGSGIRIQGAPNNIIGGTNIAAGNVIADNRNQGGIALIGNGSSGTVIQGNFLGTNYDGTAAINNNATDIYVESGNNIIGGTAFGTRNIISGFAVRGGSAIFLSFGATGNVIQGNFIGTDATGTVALNASGEGITVRGANNTIIGGTTPAARNIISGNGRGISIDGGTTNLLIQGNYIGTNAAGTAVVGNRFQGVFIDGSSNNSIGGSSAGAGNVISGNSTAGGYHGIALSSASGNTVQGNFIGTNATGTAALGNGGNGIVLAGLNGPSNNNIIGGTTAAARNIISASAGDGIRIANGSGNTVQGNYIGTDVTGTMNLGNGFSGIEIEIANNSIIGGTGAGAGNLIAFNGVVNPNAGDGLRVYLGAGNQIRGNSIFSNVRLGINLLGGTENSGVTANDACDADTGSNNLQNFPVITSATSSGGSTTITGTLNSTANAAFTVDFYASPACDASGNGEGKTFLGSTTANADGSCNASINAALPRSLQPGQVITATATDAAGNTSEFSKCFQATVIAPILHAKVSDFDGDGKTDPSVFRPSTGDWYALQSTAGFRATPFGTNGDQIAPGDFDGDGKTDTAVFRPSIGYWYILNSIDSSFRAIQFGQSGDIPATGDYDGDGKSDVAVFRPSAGTFYLLYSADNSFHFQQWGQAGDRPVMGDYDGDDKTDFAVFRPAIGAFYILRSSNAGVIGQQFGQNGDKPIAGDFDFDNKTDIAVYRPATGAWYYQQSSDNGFRGVAWGAIGDLPSAGDYDGDGKCDVSVFRPSSGVFYILQSATNSLRAEPFGTNGDVPVPSA